MEEFHFEGCESILIGVIVALVVIRLAYVLYWSGRPRRALSQRVSTLIVLGSGGHTAEMLSIVNVLEKDRFVPRIYIAAGTDNMSLQKARVLEESLIQKGEIGDNKDIEEVAYFEQIYRSREVGQSYLTSIYTTLVAILHALWLMLKFRPEVIICNGPGTCIPICLVAFIFKINSMSNGLSSRGNIREPIMSVASCKVNIATDDIDRHFIVSINYWNRVGYFMIVTTQWCRI